MYVQVAKKLFYCVLDQSMPWNIFELNYYMAEEDIKNMSVIWAKLCQESETVNPVIWDYGQTGYLSDL